MRIEQVGGPQKRLAARTQAEHSGFSIPAETSGPAHDSPAVASPIVLGPCLALDAPTPPSDAQANQAAAQHGSAMLDALAGLQIAALAPDGGQAANALAALAQGAPRAADPQLDAVLQAIAARAAVALARSNDRPM